MNHKPLYILLGVIALLLAGNLIVSLAQRPAPAPSIILPAAQAQNFSSGPTATFVLDNDSFFITSDATGQNVYLWWFEREPRKDESTLKFISKALIR